MTDSVKAAAWTALFTFVTLFGLSAAGWLQAVVEWAADSGGSSFPDTSVLIRGFLSAAAAAAVGFVNWVVRFAQSRNLLPGNGPTYQPPSPNDEGQSSVQLVFYVVCIIVLILVGIIAARAVFGG